MNDFLKRYGSWGLVAGAAEGLGEAYCMALASRGMNVFLVDIKKDKMIGLSGEIEKKYEVKTRCLHLDLSDNQSFIKIIQAIDTIDCHIMIYNAAYSTVKLFMDNTLEELDYFIDVNCRTPLKLIHSFIDYLKDKGGGGILLMSSLAGLWGTQLVAPYGATKAFNLNLAEALYHEQKHKNIDVMACIAGATATQAYLDTNPKYGRIKPKVQQPAEVAEAALSHLGKGPFYISGGFNRFTYFLFTRILSRRKALSILNRTMKSMYSERVNS